ncbi:hypothetical protein NGTWS1803_23610 [Mycolicibacterium cyprinidarum]|nr:hypothetical protein NGTWS1803_23610 [Mycolicibacterium sp. NGTWS1803]
MVAHPPPGAPEDGDRDDLAALDFSIGNEDGAEDDLGAILSGHLSDAAVEEARNDPDDDLAAAVFTVANPPGTVTVTTLIDGRVHQIELSPEAATLTETVLAEEIVVIADLATQDARSSQYASMLDGMREQGHDNVATRDFLKRDLDLPTPEEAQAARAALFTTRYAGEE